MTYTKAQEKKTVEDEKMDHRDQENNEKESKDHQRNKGYKNSSRKEIRH